LFVLVAFARYNAERGRKRFKRRERFKRRKRSGKRRKIFKCCYSRPSY
jgi:hypothetical protein